MQKIGTGSKLLKESGDIKLEYHYMPFLDLWTKNKAAKSSWFSATVGRYHCRIIQMKEWSVREDTAESGIECEEKELCMEEPREKLQCSILTKLFVA